MQGHMRSFSRRHLPKSTAEGMHDGIGSDTCGLTGLAVLAEEKAST
jgi:hypothetical protein